MVFNPIAYVRQSKEELGKVVWPTKVETVRLTLVVLIVSVIIGAYIAGIDAILARLTEELFK